MQPKIALIHATRLAIAPIEKTFQDFWPEANTFNLLDEGLLKDIDSLSSQQMNKRFQSLASYATDTGCDAILFSCSVFSDSIDSVKKIFDLRKSEKLLQYENESLRNKIRKIKLYKKNRTKLT